MASTISSDPQGFFSQSLSRHSSTDSVSEAAQGADISEVALDALNEAPSFHTPVMPPEVSQETIPTQDPRTAPTQDTASLEDNPTPSPRAITAASAVRRANALNPEQLRANG